MNNAKFYEVINPKIGVILFHAYTGSPNDFTFLAKKLQKNHIEVLCPTFQGHATEDIYDILEAHPDDWWIQAQEALDYMLTRNYEQLFVFGLSLGGIYATRLLTENHFDNLSGGVFNSPVYSSKPIEVAYFFDLYAKELYRKQGKQHEYKEEKEKILAKHHEQVSEIYYFATSFQMSLQDIQSRFYIAQSLKDEMIDAEDAYLLKEALVNAQVTLDVFPENTHVITTNRNRADFEKHVLSFIFNQ